MSTPGLSSIAAYVFRSLRDHPELRFSDAIAAGPVFETAPGVQEVDEGLAELAARGLAVEEPGRGWRLTDAALSGE